MISVLCIDDEQEVRQLIVEELSEAGFVAYEASTAGRAWS
ncbi:UNVERIFIED_ORG: CheY-like chemotaxis protein [Rhizobium esperanzae]